MGKKDQLEKCFFPSRMSERALCSFLVSLEHPVSRRSLPQGARALPLGTRVPYDISHLFPASCPAGPPPAPESSSAQSWWGWKGRFPTALLLWVGFCSSCLNRTALGAVLNALWLPIHLILPAFWQGVRHSHFTDEQTEARQDE